MQMPSMCVVAEMKNWEVLAIWTRLKEIIDQQSVLYSDEKYDELYFSVVDLIETLEELL